jgi:hypothetical protein
LQAQPANVMPMTALPDEVAPPKRMRRRQPDSIFDENGHELLSPSVVAGMIGVTIETLRTMRHQMRGPSPTKIGARVWYYRDEVGVWLRENRRFIDF